MKKPTIIWSDQARLAVKTIFEYYKSLSIQGANKVRSEIIQCPKNIVFSKQFQIDDINLEYRRIIVRDFKVLYKEVDKAIQIFDVVSTKESPEKLKNIESV